MTDIQKLKALGQKQINPANWFKPGEKVEGLESEDLEFIAAANPAAVLELIAEIERLKHHETANAEWQEKTEWVQQTAHWSELGMHRADVLRKRCDDAASQLQAQADQIIKLMAESEALRESNDKLTRRNEMLEQNVKVMTETHVLYTWLRRNVDQPSNDFVAVHMNIGHDWTPVHDLDRDLRGMIEREEP